MLGKLFKKIKKVHVRFAELVYYETTIIAFLLCYLNASFFFSEKTLNTDVGSLLFIFSSLFLGISVPMFFANLLKKSFEIDEQIQGTNEKIEDEANAQHAVFLVEDKTKQDEYQASFNILDRTIKDKKKRDEIKEILRK